MFQPTIRLEHRKAVLRGMNKMFALAGKKYSEHYQVLPDRVFSLRLPIEMQEGVGEFVWTQTTINLLKEWRQQQKDSPFPVLCIDMPLCHVYQDNSADYVWGVCSIENAIIVTTHRHNKPVSEEEMNASLSLTVLHELGHELNVCPSTREGAIVDKRGSHCPCKVCAMYPHLTPKNIQRWKEHKPLCSKCLNDLRDQIPPFVASLANTG